MSLTKYFFAVWIALVFYAVSSFFAGSAGLSAYNQLNSEKSKQIANLNKLHTINEELMGMKEALSYDNDTISVYARELGYGENDEHFIRIVGLNGNPKIPMSPGETFIPATPRSVKDKTLRIISVCIAFSLMLCVGVVDILQFVREA
jgi:cell division protein FtsB